jgi:hypothetical protein
MRVVGEVEGGIEGSSVFLGESVEDKLRYLKVTGEWQVV